MNPVHVAAPDGVNLAVYQWGAAGGGEVLLLHGFCSSAAVWAKQQRAQLAGELRLVAYDLRGHGSSDKPLEPVYYKEPERWADELHAVLDGMALRRPVVVAWGYAAAILGDYLARYGHDRISGIQFVGGFTRVLAAWHGPTRRHVPYMLSENVAENVAATRAYLRGCFVQQPAQEDFETLLGAAMMVPVQVRRAMIGRAIEMEQALGVLDVPVRIAHGELDAVAHPDMGRYTAAKARRGHFSLYEGCGHAPFFEAPDRFNRALVQLVKEVNS
jgi:pimeloyl-ACP methyl ester carboxylesterase